MSKNNLKKIRESLMMSKAEFARKANISHVTITRIERGAGSIFQLAKQNLSVEDFSIIAKSVLGIDQMMGAAPKVEESSGTFGSISSMVGSKSKKLSGRIRTRHSGG